MGENVQQTITIYNGDRITTSSNITNDLNPTVNIGLIRILTKFLTGETSSIPSYLAYGDLGENATSPAITHTSLNNEFENESYERIKLYNAGSSITEEGSGTITFTFVDNSSNAWTIKEIGIFLGIKNNNMIAEY